MTATAWLRRARAAGVLAALGLVLPPVGGAAMQPAHAAGRCAPGTGVTVVVDYGALGGVQVGCAPAGGGQQGADVMQGAGFSFDRVSTEPGFVCSIREKPDPARSCQRTPPSDAYWALFISDGSSSTWHYASAGVDGVKVSSGGSIGWRFQGGGARRVPSKPPTQEKAPAPSPRPSPEPAKPGGSGGAAPTPGPTRAPVAPVPSASASTAPSASPAGKRAPAAKAGRAGRDGKKQSRKVRAEQRAERAADRPADRAADDSSEETAVTTADSELVQPVSGDGGSGTDDVLLLAGAGLAAVGLAGFGIVTARRRRA